MTQRELNRAVARATGESLCTIAQRGFSIADPEIVDYDPKPYDLEEQFVYWETLAEERLAVVS